jgi:Ca2+-binding EF-hand superfamily protein
MKLDTFSSLISGSTTESDILFANLDGNMTTTDQQVLIDELHKVFQYIDKEGRGYLEVSEILEF